MAECYFRHFVSTEIDGSIKNLSKIFRNSSTQPLRPWMNGGVWKVNPLEVWAKAKVGATHNETEQPFEKYNCEARGGRGATPLPTDQGSQDWAGSSKWGAWNGIGRGKKWTADWVGKCRIGPLASTWKSTKLIQMSTGNMIIYVTIWWDSLWGAVFTIQKVTFSLGFHKAVMRVGLVVWFNLVFTIRQDIAIAAPPIVAACCLGNIHW